MSLAVVKTRALCGIDAPAVTVEIHLSNGLPSLSIVGLPEAAVRESKDRVRSAILNSQFEFPARRITINLAPADLPKDGGRFDLAIAIGILAASGQISSDLLDDYELIGELALSGELRGSHGVIPAALAATNDQHKLIIASANANQAALCEGTEIFSASTLLDVCSHLNQTATLSPISFTEPTPHEAQLDISDIQGQIQAKRALEIAAAGGHNLLFYGPPGTGKTMLASRLPSLMPQLSQQQAVEVASIHSLCGHDYPQWQTRPFRSPHHTASAVAMVGGGSRPKPGEISLAHHGVLFLDELPEFQRQVLEVMREPLESGEVRISRASAQLKFPARFQLVAAMNPCPCGYLGANKHAAHHCRCTREQVQRYRQKISGPLLDRIDLHVQVNNLPTKDLYQPKQQSGDTSASVRERVISARNQQLDRQGCTNAELSSSTLQQHCALGESEQNLMISAAEQLGLSARSFHRVLKVARTIADLSLSETIELPHLEEALSMRTLQMR